MHHSPEGAELAGKWVIESPTIAGQFYVLSGELPLPRGFQTEEWYRARAEQEFVRSFLFFSFFCLHP
eukprot:COSAG01_NODE_3561_length_5931_cov_4.674211_5_plen_66_part_01